MSEHLSSIPEEKKKILDKSPMSGIAVPIAIILVGALIIFGVTKMLSSQRDYKNLVNEMHSKTFGNRWVAAYELSKVMGAGKVPKTDYPWLVENLSSIYKNSVDARTRNFIILALASLKHPIVLPTLELALKDEDEKVRFNTVVSLGNFKKIEKLDWDLVINQMKSDDVGLQQVASYTLSQHNVHKSKKFMTSLLGSKNTSVRFAAAIALTTFKVDQALSALDEIVALGFKNDLNLNGAQVEALKINIVKAYKKTGWEKLRERVAKLGDTTDNVRVSTTAKEALNSLKN